MNFNINISFTNPFRVIVESEQSAALAKLEKQMAKVIETLDEVATVMKAQTTAIGAMDVLVQSLSDTIASGIRGSATLKEAEEKAVAILTVAKENSAALIAAANVGTPDETPADVEVVKEFEAAPPQSIDEPEGK